MGSGNSKDDSDARPVGPQRDIREADRLIIDASALTCPTCFETFVKSPLVLHCGHSFCRTCTSHFIRSSSPNTRYLLCPLCQRQTPLSNNRDPNQLAAVNFALDNILDGLRAMALEETMDEQAVALVPTLRFENKRLRSEVQERDRTIAVLQRDIQEAEKKSRTFKTALVGLSAHSHRSLFEKGRRFWKMEHFVFIALFLGIAVKFLHDLRSAKD